MAQLARMMARTLALASALAFAGGYLSFLAFLWDVSLPWRIDGPGDGGHPLFSGVADGVLVLMFVGHHSALARPSVQRQMSRWVAEPFQRSVYVACATALLVFLMWAWKPLPALVWRLEQPAAIAALGVLALSGLLLQALAMISMDALSLVGLRQVERYARGQPAPAAAFRAVGPYRWVRHPMMTGFLLIFWSVPRMSVGHLLLSLSMTVYLIVAVRWLEEPDLGASLGPAYARYQRRVPVLLPWRFRPWDKR